MIGDYEARTVALVQQAHVVRQGIREDLQKLDVLYQRHRDAVDQARVQLQECEFRHEIGEFTQEDFQRGQQAAEHTLSEREQEFESVRTLRLRYLELLPGRGGPPPAPIRPSPVVVAGPRETSSGGSSVGASASTIPTVPHPAIVRPADPPVEVPAAIPAVPRSPAAVPPADLPVVESPSPAENATVFLKSPLAEEPAAIPAVPLSAPAVPSADLPAEKSSSPAEGATVFLKSPSTGELPSIPAVPLSTATAPLADLTVEEPSSPAEDATVFLKPPSAADFQVPPRRSSGNGEPSDTILLSAAMLIEDRDGLPGARHRLSGISTTIGRTSENQITVADKEVSRRHAEIVRTEAGFVVKDLGSPNGTFVNGERVTEHSLKEGDRIKMGGKFFIFKAP